MGVSKKRCGSMKRDLFFMIERDLTMNREDARNQGSQANWKGAKLIVWASKWMLARVALLALLTAVGTICAGWTAAYAQSDGTTVYGNIAIDTTWTLDNSPYQVAALL